MRPALAAVITGVTVDDVRFPTSRTFAGSDAMNSAPDYSAAYVTLHTDHPAGLAGHGLAFTIGRGTEIVVAAVQALAPLVRGRCLADVVADPGAFWRHITNDSQLRWIGPEKGAIHLATAALVNAVWDLWAKAEGKPLWKLVSDLSPEELVRCVDFRYITDALTPDEAVALLRSRAEGKAARESEILRAGFPAYVTSVGWIGLSDAEVIARCSAAIDDGWHYLKIKVGGDIDADLRRAALVRDVVGWERKLMMDANQVWDVEQAIDATRRLQAFDPWWMEEPTNPDDVLGHARIAQAVAPVRIATGEHCHNRVMFKQLMQAGAIGVCQLDMCRLGGVNEALAVLLLAARFEIPVCPHAGGVGLGEYAQHLSLFDYVAIGAGLEGRLTEYVSELHENFVNPARVLDGRYLVPRTPGCGVEMRAEAIHRFSYPSGEAWAA
ncbi:MAG TPA: enolase C-terminal domain-like protein [Solirubrobacteraceae bacterium]|jgi:L-fuconate dehydratase